MKKTRNTKSAFMIYLIAFVSAITGFLFGFDSGIISGMLETISKDFKLDQYQIGFLMGLLPFGALFASCLTGRLSDWIGRLQVLYLIAIIFSVAIVGILLTNSFAILCLMRFCLGISIGMSVVVTPLYIAETAPTEIRGKLITCFQLAITLGILAAYLINLFVAGKISWRSTFAIGLIPSTALFAGALFLPESPRWLFLKGKTKEAHQVLHRLYRRKFHPDRVEHELAVIKKSILKKQSVGIWKELISKRGFPCLVLGMGLFFLQQVSGINVVIYFAPKIFQQMQLGTTSVVLLATVGLGTVNALMTFVAMNLVERIGRRPLLILGFSGAALSLGMIALFTQFEGPVFQWLSAGSIFLYIAAFAVSLGPLPYILMSEVFPLKIRGQGMSLSAASNWGFNTLVVASFPILLGVLGISYVFLLYAMACVLGLLYAFRYVPETKGLSLEEIEEHVHSNKPLRKLGRT